MRPEALANKISDGAFDFDLSASEELLLPPVG